MCTFINCKGDFSRCFMFVFIYCFSRKTSHLNTVNNGPQKEYDSQRFHVAITIEYSYEYVKRKPTNMDNVLVSHANKHCRYG